MAMALLTLHSDVDVYQSAGRMHAYGGTTLYMVVQLYIWYMYAETHEVY